MTVKWYDTAEVGDWLTHTTVGPGEPPETVRKRAADPSLWDVSRRAADHGKILNRDELTSLITEAGGVSREYALQATRRANGSIVLTDGVHRWERSDALGVKRLPVEMGLRGEPEDLSAYEHGLA